MKKVIKSFLIALIVTVLCLSAVSMTVGASAQNTYSGSTASVDETVLLTQKWLNQEYGDVESFGSVTENGKTGWNTVYGLLRALQHELGITNLADSFGQATTELYAKNLLQRQDGVTDKKYAILQGALWCKGYNPGYNLYVENGKVVFECVFDEEVENAVIAFKKDAGFINPDGVVTVNVMKALLSMDSFKLLSSYGGTDAVREMQQELNRKYEAYTGLNPCDGIYGRNTNKALIYALQAAEGLPVGVANGNFGPATKLCCPVIPYDRENADAATSYPGASDGELYTDAQITEFTKLLQYSLLVNGYDTGEPDGVFDDAIRQALSEFQKNYAIPETGKADIATWMSLLTSSGDTSRSAIAADCATILTAPKAKTLYDNGYRYIGRYLTGTYNDGISKAITREEAQIIFAEGLNFFPIYQTSARSASYFTVAQGTEDANSAIEAAKHLGLPQNTIIYFAVDFDANDSQVTSSVLPYFKKVSEIMNQSIYRTGIYGTRNVCIRSAKAGYTFSSFVSDMSTGFSGNLGFAMPDDWAFDQFATISLGSGDGYIEIDKNGFSGRDCGVSQLGEVVHSYKSTVTKSATCTASGTKTYTCSCGDSYTETIPKTAHKETTLSAKSSSCTKTGLTQGKKCSVCNTVTAAQKTVAKKSHTLKTTTTKATLSANGKTVTACSVCGYVSKTVAISRPTSIKLSATKYTYNGKARTPSVTVKDSAGKTLKKDTDYTVKYESGRKSVGKYSVTITFKGNYSGTKKLTFTIVPKVTSKITATQTTTSITLKWSKVTGATGYRVYQYNSKTKKYEKIKTTTSRSYTIKKLKAGTTYKFKIKAYSKVDGTTLWGSATDAFSTATKPKTPTLKVTSTSKAKAALTWTNVSGESGYQVYYSTKKSSGFKKMKSYKTNTKKAAKTKLKSGKTYYFKVRAYKKVDGKVIYGAYSSVKSVKIK